MYSPSPLSVRLGRKRTALSLFCGAGGMDIGFSLEDFDVITSVDIDSSCIQTIKHNVRGADARCLDVRDVRPDSLPRVDVILAGFPCQGFSVSGKRQSHDVRNMLYRQVVRIAKHLRPTAVVLENVLNLCGIRHPESDIPFDKQIAKEFGEIGYSVVSGNYKVCDFGVPQVRRRFIAICFMEGLSHNYRPPRPNESATTAREFIYDLGRGVDVDLPNHAPVWGFKSKVHVVTGEAFNESDDIVPIRISRTSAQSNPLRNIDLPFETVDTATTWAWGHGNVVAQHVSVDRSSERFARNHDLSTRLWRISASRMRRFTPREYARLQTFPDTWEFIGRNDTDVRTQIGNAVPVVFAQHVAWSVRDVLR